MTYYSNEHNHPGHAISLFHKVDISIELNSSYIPDFKYLKISLYNLDKTEDRFFSCASTETTCAIYHLLSRLAIYDLLSRCTFHCFFLYQGVKQVSWNLPMATCPWTSRITGVGIRIQHWVNSGLAEISLLFDLCFKWFNAQRRSESLSWFVFKGVTHWDFIWYSTSVSSPLYYLSFHRSSLQWLRTFYSFSHSNAGVNRCFLLHWNLQNKCCFKWRHPLIVL